jgi:hypothetical protein
MSTPIDEFDDVAENADEDRPLTGSLTRHSRRTFIRGIAAAGASTVAAASGLVQIPGVPLFEADEADAATNGGGSAGRSPFSEFTAIAPSSEDDVIVPRASGRTS